MLNQITHFKILEEIGSGGSGVVYKASDERLKRYVAIKVLTPHPEFKEKDLQRFLLEAQAASSINHPNICTIYDIGKQNNTDYIVMEYIDGETLRELLQKQKTVTEEQVIDFGIQICEALSAAHAKGIIHRDIKPDNIMISKIGTVKVTDFGLAKLKQLDFKGVENEDSKYDVLLKDVTFKTTMSTFLGTLTYMSPEQIEKKPIDERTDIFSLGIVLYELLTGQQPFVGSNNIELMGSVLEDTPEPPSQHLKDKNTQLDATILKALEKSPNKRYNNVAELKTQLKNIKHKDEIRKTKKRKIVFSIFLGLFLVVIVFLILFQNRNGSIKGDEIFLNSTQTLKSYPVGFTSNFPGWPSFYPKNNSIIYASSQVDMLEGYYIYEKDLQSGEVKLTKARAQTPDLSPDATKITFTVNNGIYISDANWENSRKISNFGWQPKWSPDGKKIVFSKAAIRHPGVDNAIFLYNLNDSTLRKVSPENGKQFADPQWSPDGRWVVCCGGEGSQWEMWLMDITSGNGFQISDYGNWISNPLWCPSGKFIYFISNRDGQRKIYKVKFDMHKSRLIEDPIFIMRLFEISTMDISSDGNMIVYSSQEEKNQIYSVPFTESIINPKKEPQLIFSNIGDIENLEVSPDGAKMIIEMIYENRRILFIKSLIDKEQYVLYDEQPAFSPSWSRDGEWIAFDAGGGNDADIWRIPAIGGQPEKIIENPGADWMPTYSPDGKYLCFVSNRTGQFDLWIKNLETGEITQLTDTAAPETRGWWSHDSKKIAYYQIASDEINENEGLWIYDLENNLNENILFARDFIVSHTNFGNNVLEKFVWKNDDSGLYFIGQAGGPLMEISLNQKIVMPSLNFQEKKIKPDSRKLAVFEENLYYISNDFKEEVWIVEGLRDIQ